MRKRPPAPNHTPPKLKKRLLPEVFDIPQTALSGIFRLEASSNREVIVEGCQGVLEYGEEVIRLSAGKMILRLEGRGLQISVLTRDSAVVTGFITSISFS